LDVFDMLPMKFKQKIMDLRKFIAFKLIMFDLREPMLKQLYMPNVTEGPMSKVLDIFEPVLGQLTTKVSEGQVSPLVNNVLVSFIEAYRFVLLDGGIDRHFKIEDAAIMEKDLEDVKEVFMCKDEDGECMGLSDKLTTVCVRPAQQLINDCFKKDSRELVEKYPELPDEQVGSNQSKIVYFRVLRHREQDCAIAKKFVKKIKGSKSDREHLKELIGAGAVGRGEEGMMSSASKGLGGALGKAGGLFHHSKDKE